MKWESVYYDVWGNSEDGYNVNDIFPTGNVVNLPENFTTEDVQSLFSVPVSVDASNEDVIYIEAEEDGKPICELRRIL